MGKTYQQKALQVEYSRKSVKSLTVCWNPSVLSRAGHSFHCGDHVVQEEKKSSYQNSGLGLCSFLCRWLVYLVYFSHVRHEPLLLSWLLFAEWPMLVFKPILPVMGPQRLMQSWGKEGALQRSLNLDLVMDSLCEFEKFRCLIKWFRNVEDLP